MIITPEICEALFPRGEDYDFCPKMIKHLSEADPKLRQSYLETKLFGSNIYRTSLSFQILGLELVFSRYFFTIW